MNRSMSRLLIFHAVTTLILAAIFFQYVSESAALSFAFGGIVSFFNLLTLVVVWPWLLAKKLVALSIGAIVIKFAISAWILFEVATTRDSQSVRPEWFALGLGVVILTVLAASVLLPRTDTPSAGGSEAVDRSPNK